MSVWAGKWALVTGASSGLGAEFARQLARQGCHVILTARREDRLNDLRREIQQSTGVNVDVIPLDLMAEDAPVRLHEQIQRSGRTVDVLINNAGHGLYGDFLDLPWDRERRMLQLDIVTLTHLTKLFTRDMVTRGLGWVLLTASIGAYQPCPSYATYCAGKSYVLHFGEALAYELRRSGVRVTVLSPGYTETEFLQVSGQRKTWYQGLFAMTSEAVVRVGLRALGRGKASVVPGWFNKLGAWSMRWTPRRWQAAIAAETMRNEPLETGQRGKGSES